MEGIKISALSRNIVDDLASALVESMRFCDPSVDYPEFKGVKKDDGVIAEWFYPIANGSNSFSELSAIHMYTGQEAKFEEIGELMLGIGLVEMKHYGKLNDFIRDLGGHIGQTYKSDQVQLGKTVLEALQIAAKGEQDTIDFYQTIVTKLEKAGESKTVEIAKQLLSKLIADETVHLELLNNKITEYETK